ncbi:Asp-tRNA(Asn)/Glu-tRNA(Gln) amidotransferase subunit GatC [Gammaproteobacteria bacterium]|jgi:aspartyl-tRNA(Asn)/glutamyl-tRNA(Gln) amidotransferase subunit C|nr:Asp-tRNA(Asn)/Glu-tRNA(Gln) amidotransferase subunit GatC [Gammaproteobacteria bacterium]MDB2375868.1 Asp-tRNA(Asn)/Glu-tRNA(Gln) amidotransferase subunit GatC [Gammaproteobacteria bacterium]
MALTKTEVEKIAHLARLHISDTEAEEVAKGVSDILGLIDKMQSIDTDNVEPLAHPFDAVQKLRPDAVTETDRRDELQKLAPQIQDGLFLVPKVIE